MPSLLTEVIKELREDKELAEEFYNTLRKTVGPWESVGSDSATIISGSSSTSPTVGIGFTRTTIFGELVASITVGHPKWSILVEGEGLKGVTPIFHRSTSELDAKKMVDTILEERGYTLL